MNQDQFYQWFQEIWQHFSDLKKWQAYGLALISYGILKTRRSQASLIAEEMPIFGKASTVERRIQRWIANQRIEIKVACVAWARWVFASYQGEEVYLLVDETKLSDRIGCMMISLAFERRAIPLIWKCYRANSAADYPAEGQVKLIVNLLAAILSVMPDNKQIVLQADRGIGNSSNLMRGIEEIGLFFLFRVRHDAIFVAQNGERAALNSLISKGDEWHGEGELFTKKKTVKCHIHLLWDKDQDEPWCLATNLEGLTGREYAKRVWQEESFRDLKSGGWQWQKNFSRNPDTIERLLLPMAIAYAWCISLGVVFHQLDASIRRQIDCIRKDAKYSIFRQGLRYFKRMFSLDAKLQHLTIGPFHALT